tara:strand:- start:386 stop:682 length:297 start_codon:yes stop_codon:yes gene_type:complete
MKVRSSLLYIMPKRIKYKLCNREEQIRYNQVIPSGKGTKKIIGAKIILWKNTLQATPTSELLIDLIIIFHKACKKAAKKISKYIEVLVIIFYFAILLN